MIQKIILSVLLLFSGIHSLFAQDFWELVEYPDSVKIKDIVINTNNDIFIGAANIPYGAGGIYKCYHQNHNWEWVGVENRSIYSMDISQLDYIYAGHNLGISRSMDKGETWQEIYYTGVNNVTTIKTGYDSIVLAGSGDNEAILRSADYGENWEVVFTIDGYTEQWFTDFAFSVDGKIYASSRNPISGDEGIYVSTDLGNTWEHFGLSKDVYTIEFTKDGRLLAGTLSQGLFAYDFSFMQWDCLVPYVSVKDIVVTQSNKIFIACDEMPNFNGGVMVSDDNGQTFYYENSGLYPEYSIDELALDKTGILYGSTYSSRRLHKTTESVVTSMQEKTIPEKLYNYPNPFTDFTVFDFDGIVCPNRTFNLKIYNIDGRLVFESDDNIVLPYGISGERFNPGIYVALFSANNKTIRLKINCL